jgi:hypothetical protein
LAEFDNNLCVAPGSYSITANYFEVGLVGSSVPLHVADVQASAYGPLPARRLDTSWILTAGTDSLVASASTAVCSAARCVSTSRFGPHKLEQLGLSLGGHHFSPPISRITLSRVATRRSSSAIRV